MEYLKYTPEMARDWKNAINSLDGYMEKRVWDSMNESQLVSKMWLVKELLNLNVKPVNISLLAGWFAQYIVPLLYLFLSAFLHLVLMYSRVQILRGQGILMGWGMAYFSRNLKN